MCAGRQVAVKNACRVVRERGATQGQQNIPLMLIISRMLAKFVGVSKVKRTENDEARSQTLDIDEMKSVPFFAGGEGKKFGSKRR